MWGVDCDAVGHARPRREAHGGDVTLLTWCVMSYQTQSSQRRTCVHRQCRARVADVVVLAYVSLNRDAGVSRSGPAVPHRVLRRRKYSTGVIRLAELTGSQLT